HIGFLAGIKPFTAAVLGGIVSIPGAMLGGLVLGVAEAFGADIFGDQYTDVAAFTLLILALLFRPTGFLGRPGVEKARLVTSAPPSSSPCWSSPSRCPSSV